MTPVVGLDVAKGATEGQAFLDKGRPYGPHFRIEHTMEGFAQFHARLQELARAAGCPPTMVLESTGPYHAPVVRFLVDYGYAYVLLNPLIPHQAKQSASLRKVKTDAADAYRLGALFYKEELAPARQRGRQLLDLRQLTRQREAVTGLFVQIKLQFQSVLDAVFPEYRTVFGYLFSQVSLRTLLVYPTADTVLAASDTAITDTIRRACPSRPAAWAAAKAQQLIAAAHRNPLRTADLPHQAFSLSLYIQMIAEYQAHLRALDGDPHAGHRSVSADPVDSGDRPNAGRDNHGRNWGDRAVRERTEARGIRGGRPAGPSIRAIQGQRELDYQTGILPSAPCLVSGRPVQLAGVGEYTNAGLLPSQASGRETAQSSLGGLH